MSQKDGNPASRCEEMETNLSNPSSDKTLCLYNIKGHILLPNSSLKDDPIQKHTLFAIVAPMRFNTTNLSDHLNPTPEKIYGEATDTCF